MVTAQEFAAAVQALPRARFQHVGRSAGGFDCVGRIFAAAWGLGVEIEDFTDYRRTPKGSTVLAAVRERCGPRDWHEWALPGRIVVLRHQDDGEPRHFAVSLGEGRAIHQTARRSLIDLGEPKYREVIHSVWLLKGVDP